MVAADLTVPEKDMRKLLAAASPEAALLYLYVNGGNDPEKQRRSCIWRLPACPAPRPPCGSWGCGRRNG